MLQTVLQIPNEQNPLNLVCCVQTEKKELFLRQQLSKRRNQT